MVLEGRVEGFSSGYSASLAILALAYYLARASGPSTGVRGKPTTDQTWRVRGCRMTGSDGDLIPRGGNMQAGAEASQSSQPLWESLESAASPDGHHLSSQDVLIYIWPNATGEVG
ncbi:hypothetical protein H105_01038 [Trichophyton soudanense CBS 452.61]|uniref:Uncharacterized protein n=1 Tax=Trichophyton soudanense CBS 452.61 TaxID=1215331 RepID=A0A022Y577_TRISD|nr:hypothetical protein H105_01038 [Trichophyton soudanense CBS 452.61]EZG10341.1 hypothetical protein H106_00833 [Trichophyton rubrum CBS 735.88]